MEYLKLKKLARLGLVTLILSALAGCGSTTENQKESTSRTKSEDGPVIMDVTSQSLNQDGKWLTNINKSSANPSGENQSPQLNFTEVEDATCYAVYMVDTSAGNWLHWKVQDLDKTTLEAGEVLDNSKYVGPYPPSGKHTYQVFVYALKKSPDSYAGIMDAGNTSMDEMEKSLDVSNGESGNILGKGSLKGTVETGVTVEE